jgi:hypothetical protein
VKSVFGLGFPTFTKHWHCHTMQDMEDTQALLELLCAFKEDNTWDEQNERQGARTFPVGSDFDCGRLSLDCESEGGTVSDLQLPSPAVSPRLSSTDIQRSESLLSYSTDCCHIPASPSEYRVRYEFHKKQYTITIQRGCKSFSSSSLSETSSQTSPEGKRRGTVSPLNRLRSLEDLKIRHEKTEVPSRSSSSKASSTTTSATSGALTPGITQLQIRRSFRGGWHIDITDTIGKKICFRARPDFIRMRAWKDHTYIWSEGATGKVIARSCQSRKRRPFMNFTSDQDNEQDKDGIPQQTQDDLVACWKALLWAEQFLPPVNAGCSVKSSKSRLAFCSLTCSTVAVLMHLLTRSCFDLVRRRIWLGDESSAAR